MDSVAISHLAAMIVGVLVGIAIALPWRPFIRRRVLSGDVAELSAALHKALAELDALNRAQAANPFRGEPEPDAI